MTNISLSSYKGIKDDLRSLWSILNQYQKTWLAFPLEAVLRGNAKKVVVMQRDRLARLATNWNYFPTYWSLFSARKEQNSWFTVRAKKPQNLQSNLPKPSGDHHSLCGKSSRKNEQGKAYADESMQEKKKRKISRANQRRFIVHLGLEM